ncbi:MAG: aromatic ring-hydroxylating dioxygenase subunit alpha [Burkholderiaceae bacterium]
MWIWLGAKDDADASLIPNCFSLDDPGWAYKPGYFRYDASHRLIIDNLLDFSHLAYVHPTTLGGTETATRSKVSRNGSGVRIERWLLGDEPAPFHTKIQAFDGKVDRWWFYDFLLPGVLVMHSGVQAENTGAQDGQHAGALEFRSCQAVTPETRRSSHYFFAVPRNFALNDGRVNESIYENIVCAFDEDRRIIEAQQQRIDLDPLARMVPIGADAALNHFRALADKQLAAEADAGLRAARA